MFSLVKSSSFIIVCFLIIFYLCDMERHLMQIPCTRVHCCDQHKCLDMTNRFPDHYSFHYGKYLHDLLQYETLVWENHKGSLKLIRHIRRQREWFAGQLLQALILINHPIIPTYWHFPVTSTINDFAAISTFILFPSVAFVTITKI